MVGMGDLNEGIGALSDVARPQLGDTVFGYYIMCVGSRCYYAGSLNQICPLNETSQQGTNLFEKSRNF